MGKYLLGLHTFLTILMNLKVFDLNNWKYLEVKAITEILPKIIAQFYKIIVCCKEFRAQTGNQEF